MPSIKKSFHAKKTEEQKKKKKKNRKKKGDYNNIYIKISKIFA